MSNLTTTVAPRNYSEFHHFLTVASEWQCLDYKDLACITALALLWESGCDRPEIDTIARKARMSDDCAQKTCHALQAKGWVTIEEQKIQVPGKGERNEPNLYTLHLPPSGHSTSTCPHCLARAAATEKRSAAQKPEITAAAKPKAAATKAARKAASVAVAEVPALTVNGLTDAQIARMELGAFRGSKPPTETACYRLSVRAGLDGGEEHREARRADYDYAVECWREGRAAAREEQRIVAAARSTGDVEIAPWQRGARPADASATMH